MSIMKNNNSKKIFYIDETKSQELLKKLKPQIPNIRCYIDAVHLTDLNKYIILIEIIKENEEKELEINYSTIKIIKIREFFKDKVVDKLDYNKLPTWLTYLFRWSLFDFIFHPQTIFDLLKNNLKEPDVLDIQSNRDSKMILFITETDPLKDQKDLMKFINDFNVDTKIEEISTPNNDEDNLINGYYIYYHPPQIFLGFKGEYDISLRLFKDFNQEEVIFQKIHETYGHFILWRTSQIFIEEFKENIDFLSLVNLFLFYIHLHVQYLEFSTNLDIFKVKNLHPINIPTPNHFDKIMNMTPSIPHKDEFYRNYWHLDKIESIFPLISINLLDNIFENAYNFMINIFPNENLRDYINLLFKSIVYYRNRDYKLSFFLSWLILEDFIIRKWEEIIKEGVRNKEFSKREFEKDLKKRLKAFKDYPTSSKIDLLLLYNKISVEKFEKLRNLNNKRNNLIHSFEIDVPDIADTSIELAILILKEEYSNILNKLIENIDEKFNFSHLRGI